MPAGVRDVHQQTRVEQEVVVIDRAAWNGVGGCRLPGGNLLLLRVADEIINLVLSVLIAYAAAEGKDIIDIIARLQKGRQVGDVIRRIAPGGVNLLVVQPPEALAWARSKNIWLEVKRSWSASSP
ncbi:Uncharacterised protein [Klebsiella pneumoniae]|uniref:Uncharacterized protein n=1 Tax=Klebsiella pneumoniae TaxID=573 RepID=A0A377XGH1_KLEPN|nr:Uncharacterised protein [Klebsiella pneumoniae]